MLSNDARRDLTNVVIYIILRAISLSPSGAGNAGASEKLRHYIFNRPRAQLLYIVINKFLYTDFPTERRIVMQYATICNNAGFMGLPVIGSVFGAQGVLYGSIVLIPIRLFMWTSGLALFTDTIIKGGLKSLRRTLHLGCHSRLRLHVFAV